MGWVAHFDNADWAAARASWDGSKWIDVGGALALNPIGAWYIGYRPTKVRVTISVSVTSFYLHAGVDTYIRADGSYTSLTEDNLSWGSNDIDEFYMYVAAGLNITNIEFYEPDSWLHNYSGVDNTNIATINGVALASIKSVNRVY